MSGDLLQTKLYVPRIRPSLIPRPHLIAKLIQGIQQGGKLTLICAPAGFGKTTLVTDWLARAKRPFVWVSLDEDDNDLMRFFTYVAAAVQQMEGVGKAIQSLVQSTQPMPLKSLTTALINDCLTISTPFFLALDDYHVITETAVHEAVSFLLDNLPPQLHLVITSRTDPLLPLSRLRARGQMTEMRTDDLRFTAQEAATFLQQVMGLKLSVEQVSALESRTEGWVAGLQMAALSMQGLQNEADITAFVTDFTGSHRYIFDYLTDEVLQQRPSDTQSFLLQTSLLNRFNASLCTAITGHQDSQAILETLEKANLFLFPLDDNRQWYRYHHLFADLLRRRLHQTQPHTIPGIHYRASIWYEDHAFPEEAFYHALEGQHHRRAAQLSELYGGKWMAQSRLHKTKRWLEALPDGLLLRRPQLGTMYAWILALTNQLDQVEYYLEAAEREIRAAQSQPSLYEEWGLHDPEHSVATFKGYITTCRAVVARAHGDTRGMIEQLNEALTLLPADALDQRGVASLYLGFAQWMAGNTRQAIQSFDDAIQASLACGRIYTTLSAIPAMGRLYIELGSLYKAEQCFLKGLKLAEQHTQQTGTVIPVVAEAHTGMAKLAYEWNDLGLADTHVNLAIEIIEPLGVTEDLVDAYLEKARLQWAEKDRIGAHNTLQTVASLVEAAHVAPMLRTRVASQQAQFWVLEGTENQEYAAKVSQWVRTEALSSKDNPTYPREREYIIFARWLLVTGQVAEAISLLDRLIELTTSADKTGRLIEILLLKVWALLLQGGMTHALPLLKEVVAIAEPEGYVRTFVDEAAWLRPLLLQLSATPYRDALINQINQVNQPVSVVPNTSPTTPGPSTESLSERELEVLRMLVTHLSGPEIARQLHISPNTFKTHTKNIYSKLGVNSRHTAVERAQELDLLK